MEETKRTCNGTTKSGKPCQARAMEGSDYCSAQQPQPETRGRKKGEKVAMVKEVPAQPLPAIRDGYMHPPILKCGRLLTNYPAFMGKTCGTKMKVASTAYNGQVRYWKCPKCGNTEKTVGVKPEQRKNA